MKFFVSIRLLFALFSTAWATAYADGIQLSFDGKPVELHYFKQGSFGQFEFTHPGEVEIQLPFNVRWVDVRPRSAKVQAVIASDHHTVHFKVATVVPLTIEFNDDLGKVVHLFPAAPEENPAHEGDAQVRYFGPGVHHAGLIELKSGETLYLAPGAWVKGIVRSVDTKNITIRGRGVLDGGDVPAAEPVQTVPQNGEAPRYSYGTGDLNMIYLYRTENAKIEGITVFDSKHWTVYLRSTQHTTIDGVHILSSSEAYGNDGFDIVSSSHVLVQNIFVRTNDDCVVVKNLDDVATSDITVRNAVLWNMPTGGNGLEIGFELGHHPVSKILFQNIDLIHVQRGSAISIHNGDDALLEDVTFDDIRVEDVRRKLIDFGILYAQYGFDKPATPEERSQRIDQGGVWDGEDKFTAEEKPARAKFRGHVRNVLVKNLQVVEGALPYSLISGFDNDHTVENVTIEGLTYLGKPLTTKDEAKLAVEYAPGFKLR